MIITNIACSNDKDGEYYNNWNNISTVLLSNDSEIIIYDIRCYNKLLIPYAVDNIFCINVESI